MMKTCCLAVLGLMALWGAVSGDVRLGARLRQARFDPTGNLEEGCFPVDASSPGTARCLTRNSTCRDRNVGNGDGLCDCDDKANPPFTLSPQSLFALQPVDKYCVLDPITPMSKTLCVDHLDCELYDNTECVKDPATMVKRCFCKGNTEPNPSPLTNPGCSVVDCQKRPSYCSKKDLLLACRPSANSNSTTAYTCQCRPGTEPNPLNKGRCEESAFKPCLVNKECDHLLNGSTCDLRSRTCVCLDGSKTPSVKGTLIFDSGSKKLKCKANGYGSSCFDDKDCDMPRHRCHVKQANMSSNTNMSVAGQCVCPENHRPSRRNMQECEPTFGLCCRSIQECGVFSSKSDSLQCNGYNCVCPSVGYRWNALTKTCDLAPAFSKCDL